MTQQELIDDMNGTAQGIIGDLQGFYEGLVMDREDMAMKKEDELESEDDAIGLYEYLMDNCGIRYIIDGDMEYESCIITMAIGGPGIWLDTHLCEIRGRWGSDEIHVPIRSDIAEMVDDEMREVYGYRRGC